MEWGETVGSQDGLQVLLLSCRRNWPPACFYKAYCSALVQQSTASASFLPLSLFLSLPLPSLLQHARSAAMTPPSAHPQFTLAVKEVQRLPGAQGSSAQRCPAGPVQCALGVGTCGDDPDSLKPEV